VPGAALPGGSQESGHQTGWQNHKLRIDCEIAVVADRVPSALTKSLMPVVAA
jgi:hypothetical protein